jgi:hypothetical protein
MAKTWGQQMAQHDRARRRKEREHQRRDRERKRRERREWIEHPARSAWRRWVSW